MKYPKRSIALKRYWRQRQDLEGKITSYTRTPEHREHMSLIKKGVTHSEISKEKIKNNHADVSGENNPMFGRRGVNHPGWKGGVTKENDILRKSLEFRNWRRNVFERDNFTCIKCGDNKTGKLNADHIKPWSMFPELRFEISNGRTLCEKCHKLTDTYAGRMNRKQIRSLYA